MLRSMDQPSICYDLIGLASEGLVTLGRDRESNMITLDSRQVPALLSRQHALFQLQTNGDIMLKDLDSTNGTYVARADERLNRVQGGECWKLQAGDTVSFGGAYSIVMEDPPGRLPNPFKFKFFSENCNNISNVSDQPHLSKLCSPSARQPTIAYPSEDKENFKRSSSLPVASCGKALEDILQNHFTCPICQEWVMACHALSCGHMFCGSCIAEWLKRKQACPTCRKPAAGVPVRCLQVDNTINDVLAIRPMSPSAKSERSRRETAWEEMQEAVVQNWASNLAARKQEALDGARRHHRAMMGGQPPIPIPRPQIPGLLPPGPLLSVANTDAMFMFDLPGMPLGHLPTRPDAAATGAARAPSGPPPGANASRSSRAYDYMAVLNTLTEAGEAPRVVTAAEAAYVGAFAEYEEAVAGYEEAEAALAAANGPARGSMQRGRGGSLRSGGSLPRSSPHTYSELGRQQRGPGQQRAPAQRSPGLAVRRVIANRGRSRS
eukprot:gene19981-26692_t